MQHLDEGMIHGWLDGALGPEESRGVEEHLANCGECGGRVAEARGLIAASSRILGALDSVPGGVVPAAQAGRRADGQTGGDTIDERGRRVRRWRWAGVHMRAAAAVLFVAAGTAVVLRTTENGEWAAPAAVRQVAEQERSGGALPSAATAAPQSANVATDAAGPSPDAAELEGAGARPDERRESRIAGTAAKVGAASTRAQESQTYVSLAETAAVPRARRALAKMRQRQNAGVFTDSFARVERVGEASGIDSLEQEGTGRAGAPRVAAAPRAAPAAERVEAAAERAKSEVVLGARQDSRRRLMADTGGASNETLAAAAAPAREAHDEAGQSLSDSASAPRTESRAVFRAPSDARAPADARAPSDAKENAAHRSSVLSAPELPAAPNVGGLKLLSSSVITQSGRDVRRSIYEVRPGVTVTLEVTRAVGATVDTPVALDDARQVESRAALDAARDEGAAAEPEEDTIRSIQWLGEGGTEFRLSGPLTLQELQAVRRRLHDGRSEAP